MDVFNFNTQFCSNCYANGICNLNSAILSLKEALLFQLKQLSYYVLKLEKFNIKNEKIKDIIIEHVSIITITTDMKQNEFNEILKKLVIQKEKLAKIYLEKAKKNGIKPKEITCTLEKDFNLKNAIKNGELQSIFKNNQLSKTQKNLLEILYILATNASLCVLKLKEFNVKENYVKNEIVKLLANAVLFEIPTEKLKKHIEDFLVINTEIQKKLFEFLNKKFGDVTPQNIFWGVKPGKAILVSGDNIADLEKLLQEAEGTDIKIYTHNEMIIAHTHPKLKAYSCLEGHFQTSSDNFTVDFATFKGPILITKYSKNPILNLIRGRIYTTNPISNFGTVKISKNEIKDVISATEYTRSYKHIRNYGKIKIGYDFKKIAPILVKLAQNINKKNIKKVLIIGINNTRFETNEFADTLLNKIPEDTFVFCLGSYSQKRKNLFYINSFYDYSLCMKILEFLKHNVKTEYKINSIITSCDFKTINNIFMLKYYNVQNIYLAFCEPFVLNSSLTDTLSEEYGVVKICEDIIENPQQIFEN